MSEPSAPSWRSTRGRAIPFHVLGTIGLGRERLGSLGDLLVEFGVLDDLVDEPPFGGALAADAFLGGAEDVGTVAPDLPLVGHAGEASRTGQHGKQRHFRQRNARGAVIGEDDVIAGECQFVAAAGAGAPHCRDVVLAAFLARRFEGVPGLVGELAEIHLVGVGGPAQHADIGAGAEDIVLAAPHDDGAHLRMLETHPLDDVRQLDIHTEIIGIELELIALEQAAILVDIHEERRHIAVILDTPVAVLVRRRAEIDHFLGHEGSLPKPLMHYNARKAAKSSLASEK